ncbi:hypothetical protein PSN45_000307 [Yamadazyma tenuis]|uniref:Endonuclease/exonuclease/phosphatase domain-containing protein n=1 Tax=Candida tenuis (strain ATCC 10573 / BCRC 21748 / CBS 615 / JCM 9827 / NBRC 10315 / NRRL Y-1498 / VKM Y-70) TaxID=590646 RepID=G3B7J0_CANTC|nr:uncharacterized protein CANTEDRAFT_94512 [Yamadazyma tenuis ATCC 10573]EGV61628.1 hypothetical protein CANTEDRAFT_94512 [Yamadazyma tenuis ATCC 10573]WEJ92849.1 hypothetical protein PSN45_000307 [Yamadazyma tenuis]
MLPQFAITALLFATSLAAPIEAPLNFRVITSNVRVKTNKPFAHEQPWDVRKYGQIQTLQQQSANSSTLIGLQEIKKDMLDEVIAGLNNNQTNITSGWTYFGVGRDDGVEKGEYAAVVYDNRVWDLVNGTYKWLSPTPDIPTKGWGASNIRIVTMTELKHIQTGKHINYFNTHYDQTSEEAREHSSELIAGWISQIPNDYQTILTGDFNSIDTDLSYTTLVKDLADTRVIAYQKYSQEPTYTGFEPTDNQTVIDFIWAPIDSNTQGSNTTVIDYNVIDNVTPEGYRFSDHRPVVVDFLAF